MATGYSKPHTTVKARLPLTRYPTPKVRAEAFKPYEVEWPPGAHTCAFCGEVIMPGYAEAAHVLPRDLYPELRNVAADIAPAHPDCHTRFDDNHKLFERVLEIVEVFGEEKIGELNEYLKPERRINLDNIRELCER